MFNKTVTDFNFNKKQNFEKKSKTLIWNSIDGSVWEVSNLCNLFFEGDSVKIGEIIYKLKTPKNPELVPVKHSM